MLTCRWTEFWSREFRSRCYFEWSINCDEIPFLTTTILRFRKRILVAATKELWIHAQNSLWIAKTICATKFTELKISKKNYKISKTSKIKSSKFVFVIFWNFRIHFLDQSMTKSYTYDFIENIEKEFRIDSQKVITNFSVLWLKYFVKNIHIEFAFSW